MARDFWAQSMFQQLGQKPALALLAEALQSAREAGHFYGLATEADAIADLRGEVEELVQALEVEKTQVRIRNEVGDVVMTLLHICLTNDIDFADTMEKFTERWLRRKSIEEQKTIAAGYNWRTVPPEVSQAIWKQIKQELKAQEEA